MEALKQFEDLTRQEKDNIIKTIKKKNLITEKEISVIQIEKNKIEAKLEKIYDSDKTLDEENNTEVKHEQKINPKELRSTFIINKKYYKNGIAILKINKNE